MLENIQPFTAAVARSKHHAIHFGEGELDPGAVAAATGWTRLPYQTGIASCIAEGFDCSLFQTCFMTQQIVLLVLALVRTLILTLVLALILASVLTLCL